MNYSEEYLSFLEAHRRSMEFKDKIAKAAIIALEKRMEDELNKRPWDKYKENTV